MGFRRSVVEKSSTESQTASTKETPKAPRASLGMGKFKIQPKREEHQAVIKLYGGKADGGFSVEVDGQVYFRLDWYKSSDIIFDEEDFSVSFLPIMQSFDQNLYVTFANSTEFESFKKIHESMIPAQDAFMEFQNCFTPTNSEETKDWTQALKTRPSIVERKRKSHVDPAGVQNFAFPVYKYKVSFFGSPTW